MDIGQNIVDFVSYALKYGGYSLLDKVFLQEQVKRLVGFTGDLPSKVSLQKMTSTKLCDNLVNYANSINKNELYQELMSFLTPPPAVVNALFAEVYDDSKNQATSNYYQLNIVNGYISANNLDSIEKKHLNCQLCISNEGKVEKGSSFLNRNRRIIRLNLDQASWGFQYHPVRDDKETGLFFTEKHQHLFLGRNLIVKMNQLLNLFPQYSITYSDTYVISEHGYLKSSLVKHETSSGSTYKVSFLPDIYVQFDQKTGAIIMNSLSSKSIELLTEYIINLEKTEKNNVTFYSLYQDEAKTVAILRFRGKQEEINKKLIIESEEVL